MATSKGKVLVGMSGGVDSTVTAILLKEQGYDVVGVTFRLWSPDVEEDLPTGSCCSVDDVNDARMVCHKLGVPHYVFNYKDLFKQVVVEDFVSEYAAGRTPNPCIACNRFIKFGEFFGRAKQMEFDYIATGHYSRIIFEEKTNRWRLMRSAISDKDQSYVLYTFTQELLAHTLMPLGEYSKEEVRAIAKDRGFVSASGKPDSQDICFVPDGDYTSFLERYTGKTFETGNFIDVNGTVLGQHKGIQHYTIGQRRGLGISFGKPTFVVGINPAQNTVILGENEDLFTKELIATDVNWIDFETLTEPICLKARIRYTHKAGAVTVSPLENGKIKVVFDEPQRAITAGQAVVMYGGEFVVGGGTIL